MYIFFRNWLDFANFPSQAISKPFASHSSWQLLEIVCWTGFRLSWLTARSVANIHRNQRVRIRIICDLLLQSVGLSNNFYSTMKMMLSFLYINPISAETKHHGENIIRCNIVQWTYADNTHIDVWFLYFNAEPVEFSFKWWVSYIPDVSVDLSFSLRIWSEQTEQQIITKLNDIVNTTKCRYDATWQSPQSLDTSLVCQLIWKKKTGTPYHSPRGRLSHRPTIIVYDISVMMRQFYSKCPCLLMKNSYCCCFLLILLLLL